MYVNGNIISGTTTSPFDEIVLPDGYSVEKAIFVGITDDIQYRLNDVTDEGIVTLPKDTEIHFPVVNGKSPYRFTIYSGTIGRAWQIIITQFGGEPSSSYFNRAFEPILVKRKDVTEYKLIPTRDKGGV